MEKELKKTLKEGRFKDLSPLRSKIMGSIRGSGNYSTELVFRMLLIRNKIRGWTLHPKGIIGKPDFYFPSNKLVVFIDGCFWHGCDKCSHPIKNNKSFWNKKIERNRLRDKKCNINLRKQGYKILRFREHELKQKPIKLIDKIKHTLKNQ